MNNKTSGFGILLGLALAATIALSGASGTWNQYDTPPILVGAGVAILVQWAVFVFAWRRQSEHFFDLTGSATFISVVLIVAFLSKSALRPPHPAAHIGRVQPGPDGLHGGVRQQREARCPRPLSERLVEPVLGAPEVKFWRSLCALAAFTRQRSLV